jgi:DNA-binding NtrC family response regulator
MAEKTVIEKALHECNYNKTRAAQLLKIDRKTLYNKIKELGNKLNYKKRGCNYSIITTP